jgi:hypothetical protein
MIRSQATPLLQVRGWLTVVQDGDLACLREC